MYRRTAYFIRKSMIAGLIADKWLFPLLVSWGWVVIRSIRYTAWKLRTQEQTNQKTTIAKDDQNHSD